MLKVKPNSETGIKIRLSPSFPEGVYIRLGRAFMAKFLGSKFSIIPIAREG